MTNEEFAQKIMTTGIQFSEMTPHKNHASYGTGEKDITWHPESAGAHMIQNFPIILQPDLTIGEALKHIIKNIKKFETINYVYVTNREKKLLGTISIRELLQADRRKKLETIIKRDVVTVHPETDQETVVYIATKEKLKQIPVADEHGTLLGIVPSDALLDILSEEYSEDILRAAGAPESERAPEHVPIIRWTAMRLPWLFVGLGGGILSGIIISLFRPTLEAVVLLAVYFPIMMKTGGDTGTQSATVLIRMLSIRKQKKFIPYLTHELKSGILLGLLWSALLFFVSIIWHQFLILALVASFSILLTIIISVLVGSSLPFLFYRLRVDPALVSNPLITAIQDIVGLVIYLGAATIFFRIF